MQLTQFKQSIHLVSPFPLFNVFLLLLRLVSAIGEDVQELKSIHLPHIIPRTSASLRNAVYIGNPSPPFSKRSSSFCIALKVLLFFSGSRSFIAISLE